MALVFDTTPAPAIQQPASSYRIEPRNWGMARAKYINFYNEAARHRTVDSVKQGLDEKYRYFITRQIAYPHQTSEEIIEAAYALAELLCDQKYTHIRIQESAMKGPQSGFVLDVCIIDKMRTSANPAISDWSLKRPTWQIWVVKLEEQIECGYRWQRLLTRVPGSKTALNPAGTWVSVNDKVAALAHEAVQRTLTTARVLTGQQYGSVSDAEVAIEREVNRRIVQDRVAATTPISTLFWSIDYENQLKVFRYAMDLPDVVQPYAYRGDSGGHGFYLGHHLAPKPISLRSIDSVDPEKGFCDGSSLRHVTRAALYQSPVWRFTQPASLHKFLDVLIRPSGTSNVRQAMQKNENIQHLRSMVLRFEPDVMLRYFEKYLGFVYERNTRLMDAQLEDKRAQHLFKILAQHSDQLTITLVLPAARRMVYAGAVRSCHLILCKWIAKAAGTCAAQYPRITVLLEGHEADDREHDLDDQEMAEVRAIFNSPSSILWKDLGIDYGHQSFERYVLHTNSI